MCKDTERHPDSFPVCSVWRERTDPGSVVDNTQKGRDGLDRALYDERVSQTQRGENRTIVSMRLFSSLVQMAREDAEENMIAL